MLAQDNITIVSLPTTNTSRLPFVEDSAGRLHSFPFTTFFFNFITYGLFPKIRVDLDGSVSTLNLASISPTFETFTGLPTSDIIIGEQIQEVVAGSDGYFYIFVILIGFTSAVKGIVKYDPISESTVNVVEVPSFIFTSSYDIVNGVEAGGKIYFAPKNGSNLISYDMSTSLMTPVLTASGLDWTEPLYKFGNKFVQFSYSYLSPNLYMRTGPTGSGGSSTITWTLGSDYIPLLDGITVPDPTSNYFFKTMSSVAFGPFFVLRINPVTNNIDYLNLASTAFINTAVYLGPNIGSPGSVILGLDGSYPSYALTGSSLTPYSTGEPSYTELPSTGAINAEYSSLDTENIVYGSGFTGQFPAGIYGEGIYSYGITKLDYANSVGREAVPLMISETGTGLRHWLKPTPRDGKMYTITSTILMNKIPSGSGQQLVGAGETTEVAIITPVSSAAGGWTVGMIKTGSGSSAPSSPPPV